MLQPQFISVKTKDGHEYINLAEIVTASVTREGMTLTLRDGSTRQVVAHQDLQLVESMFRRLSQAPPAQRQ